MPGEGEMVDSSSAAESRPLVKICGLTRHSDASLAAREGADFLGVVLVPGGPRSLEPSQARQVVEGISVPVVAVVADLGADRVGRMADDGHYSELFVHTRPPLMPISPLCYLTNLRTSSCCRPV